MVIEILEWACPKCGFENTDEVDSELGPFLTVTCGGCGDAFDQDAVTIKRTSEDDPAYDAGIDEPEGNGDDQK